MEYKLAKQLKELGYKQKKVKVQFEDVYFEEKPEVYIPTLSELIDACDKIDGFGQLGRANKGWNVWRLGIREPIAFGKTPEEAVAKLWLELNKK